MPHGSGACNELNPPAAAVCRRLTQWWRLLPGLPFLPVAVGLMRAAPGAWVLVDTGFRDGPHHNAHATHLLAALRAVIPPGERLAAIARACSQLECCHPGGAACAYRGRNAQVLQAPLALRLSKPSRRQPLRPPLPVHSAHPPSLPALPPRSDPRPLRPLGGPAPAAGGLP